MKFCTSAIFCVGLADADQLWAGYYGMNCHAGHGGTPLDAKDIPLKNVSKYECQDICANDTTCAGLSQYPSNVSDWHNPFGDCYFRSALDLKNCDIGDYHTNHWHTYQKVDPPALTGLKVYHLFEAKYTGLENKDGGDFKGDSGFIFGTFTRWAKGNPEASMEHNIIEMSEVNVTGWGMYEECNAPGANGMFNCPVNQTEYCCTHHRVPVNHTRTQLPGLEISKETLGPLFGFGGFWYSFPKESKGVTWTETLQRRIAGKCLGDAWRRDAGGCNECGEPLDSCVADCIKASLCVNGSVALLEKTWDRVFADPTECPEVPLPVPACPAGVWKFCDKTDLEDGGVACVKSLTEDVHAGEAVQCVPSRSPQGGASYTCPSELPVECNPWAMQETTLLV